MLCFLLGLIMVAGSIYAETPFTIGNRTCLFFDDRFIAEQSGLKRIWHQGKPQPEPIIKPDHPWESWLCLYGSAFFDPEAKVYRMYYESVIRPCRPESGKRSCTYYTCYAESKDGKHWIKPELGLVEDLGSKANNIVVGRGCALPNVFIDPLEKNPAGRIKAFTYGVESNSNSRALYQSADGIHWSYVNSVGLPAYADPAEGCPSDTNVVIWDKLQQRYMADIRALSHHQVSASKDGKRRGIGISISQTLDIAKGTPVKLVLRADDLDDQKVAKMSQDAAKPDWAELYVMPFFTYGNHYIGLLSLLYCIDVSVGAGKAKNGSDNGGGDLQLTFSHEGLEWHRQPDRATLIEPSGEPGLFGTYAMSNPPLELGDELWIYYTEANGAHPLKEFSKSITQIRAAVWRKDGFVSLDCDGKGNFTTKPLLLQGSALLLNFKTQNNGAVRVALLDEQGKVLPGFDLKDCDLLKGDSVAQRVTWGKQADLFSLRGKPVCLRIECEKSRLWSFRFADLVDEVRGL